MIKSKIYLALASISGIIEDIDDDNSPITGHLNKARDSIVFTHLKSGKPNSHPEPEVQSKEVDTNELDVAYDILKDETKPGPTLLKNKMGITLPQAKKLYAKLKTSGRIGVKKPVQKEMIDIMHELPKGASLLVKQPFDLFLILDESVRAKYLTGLKLADVVPAESVGEAQITGADTTLVDEIHALAKKKVPVVKDVISPLSAKYKGLIKGWLGAIPNAKVLYKHMTRGGVNKSIMRDLKTIAVACKKGDV